MYRFYATLAGGDICAVDVEPDLRFPVDRLRADVDTGVRLVILGDPHNPTGAPVPPGLVAQIGRARPDTMILVDEAYAEFAGRTALSLLSQLPNLLVARTFSKAYGLAGLRIGVPRGDTATRWPGSRACARPTPSTPSRCWPWRLPSTIRNGRHRTPPRCASSREVLRDGLRVSACLPIRARPTSSSLGSETRRRWSASGFAPGACSCATAAGIRCCTGTLRIGVGTHRDTARCLRGAGRGPCEIDYRERTPDDTHRPDQPNTRAPGAPNRPGVPREPRDRHRGPRRVGWTRRRRPSRPESASLDHMLSSLAMHAGFDLRLEASGDLHVDQHHLVEDCGIVLGQAIARALGRRRGIERTGFFAFPMEDALALAAIDLAGRPALTWRARFRRRRVGGLDADADPRVLQGFGAEPGRRPARRAALRSQ